MWESLLKRRSGRKAAMERWSDGAIIWVQGEREDVQVLLGVLDLWFRRENQDPVHPADRYVEIAMELTPH
ncbi:hypothetical protein ACIRP7_36335 [Streptomyces sp. NPDC102270]|uniref:hypothetical protein n=1 Tax=Streptomyces sp. NPDC102270 TaxID=3366150 RepID=UPI00380D7D7A